MPQGRWADGIDCSISNYFLTKEIAHSCWWAEPANVIVNLSRNDTPVILYQWNNGQVEISLLLNLLRRRHGRERILNKRKGEEERKKKDKKDIKINRNENFVANLNMKLRQLNWEKEERKEQQHLSWLVAVFVVGSVEILNKGKRVINIFSYFQQLTEECEWNTRNTEFFKLNSSQRKVAFHFFFSPPPTQPNPPPVCPPHRVSQLNLKFYF